MKTVISRLHSVLDLGIAMCFLLVIGMPRCYALNNGTTTATPAKIAALQEHAKLLFTENRGQVTDDEGGHRPDILFTAHSGGAQLFLTATGINYQFTKITYPEGYDGKRHQDPEKQAAIAKNTKRETYRFSVSLAGANTHPVIRKELKNTYTENFYTTGCPDGITGVGTYERIVYENVYPNIDWVVYSNGNRLKYDFLVHPGGDPKQIKLKIDDAQSVTITDAGELVMKTGLGEVREQAPVSYADGGVVKTAFNKNRDGSIGFEVGEFEGELRIDPSVVWATYYGGERFDEFVGCSVDGLGNVYATGSTTSLTGIASANAYQSTDGGNYDMLLVKFDADGRLLWATYYGGSNQDIAYSCTTDRSNNVYMSGAAISDGLGSSGAFKQNWSALIVYVAILVKMNTYGERIWATYYGSNYSIGTSCKTDNMKNIYMSGVTASTSGIATSKTFKEDYSGGNFDAFLVKFDSSGNRSWGTYFGGAGDEISSSIALDNWCNIYMTGFTTSDSGIANQGAYQDTYGGNYDDFLAKFDSSGNRLWSTYYGGNDYESSFNSSVATDVAGSAYMGGATHSMSGIASSGAFRSIYPGGQQNAFLAKFDSSGVRRWGTYYGGAGSDFLYCVAIDQFENIYLSGTTSSDTGIATANAFQQSGSGFLAIFDTSGFRRWSSYCGNDELYGCAPDLLGNVYLAGNTFADSSNVTVGAFQTNEGGMQDGILIKMFDPPAINTGVISGNAFCSGTSLDIPFTVTDTFSSSNVFTAQLSNALGYFSDPVVIGTLNGSTAGVIRCTIPAKTPAGTGYRIRVVSNSAARIGSNNGTGITLYLASPPGITYINNQLCTYAYTTCQWYFNGIKIQGQTGSCITPFADGYYTVAVTDANGCAATSLPYDIHEGLVVVTLYPNPADNMLYISASEIVDVTIYTIDGKRIMDVKNATAIDLQRLPNAMYMVMVRDAYGRLIKSQKLVKMEE